ncbi:HAD hydrolase family protein [Faecalibacillus faecis]|uniref:HAD hydrolase family protein n=1 Tax=Faecalibacillus faecis TaxID=1982628 RepID=UPI0037C090AE
MVKAAEHNKTIILNTGRNPAELEEFNNTLPEICYLICISGALVYDLKENVVSKSFDEDT